MRSGLRAVKLADHVETLARRYGVTVVTSDHARGRAYSKTKTITIPPVKGQVTYFLALHEIAHVVARGRTVGSRLEQEAFAWQWALDNSIVEPTAATARSMHDRLDSYLRAYVAHNYRNGGGRVIPPAGDPFWKVYELLAELGGRRGTRIV